MRCWQQDQQFDAYCDFAVGIECVAHISQHQAGLAHTLQQQTRQPEAATELYLAGATNCCCCNNFALLGLYLWPEAYPIHFIAGTILLTPHNWDIFLTHLVVTYLSPT
jgi:hypothetical protein